MKIDKNQFRAIFYMWSAIFWTLVSVLRVLSKADISITQGKAMQDFDRACNFFDAEVSE